MINISPHGQIFLDYLIGLYMPITDPWNRGLRDLYLSHDAQNHFLSKRTPIPSQGIVFRILEYIWPILFEGINAMAKVSDPGFRSFQR